MAAKDFYKVLGLSKNASENDIKKAYHQMAKKYHPDKNKAADAEERFKEIGAAYETLKDPEKKRIYDMQKEGDEEKARMHKQTPPSNFSFNHNSSDNAGGFFGFSANRPRGFTFKSTFTSFDDDDFRRAKEEFENMNPNSSPPKRGKKKKEGKPTGARRRSFNCPRPEWNDNWNEESQRSETPKFGFPSFFMDDPFKEFDKLFEDFFSDIFSASPFGPSFSNIFMPSHHRVHQEHSPFGQSTSNDGEWNDDIFMGMPQCRRQTTPNTRRKQEEEEMYDWSKPVFGFKSYDSDSDSEYFNLEDDHGQILLKCTYCGRRFRPTILRKHEQVCEKWQKRREKTPTSEDEGTSFYFDDSPEPKRKDWNKHHDDLLNNEHNARIPKRTNRKPPQMSDPSSTEEDYVECHWCHRQFSEMAARHHIPFCDQKTKHKSDIYPDGRPTSSKTYRAKQYARNVPKPNTSRRSTESMSTDRGKKPPAAPTSDHSAPHATPKAGMGHASRARSHASRAGHGTPRTSRASTPDGNASTAYPGGPSRFAARSHPQNSHSGMGTAGFGRAESPSTSRRPYMDQPFTFTASGLHAYPPGVSTRSRSSFRAGLGGRTNQNVNFTMPDIPKVSVRSRSSSAPSVRACSQSGHRNGQVFSMDDLMPRCHRNIHIPTAAI